MTDAPPWLATLPIGKGKSTAIHRRQASAPVKALLELGVLNGRVLDFGCGHGADVDALDCEGWDPHHRPDTAPLRHAAYDFVLCSYVLNVIDPEARDAVLHAIRWLLAPGGAGYVTVRRDLPKDGRPGRGCRQHYVELDLPMWRKTSRLATYKVHREQVVCFSGGIASWAAARRLRERLGAGAPLTLLFNDTLMEDPDLYRFLGEAAADVEGDLVRTADGRDPWQVFHDERFLGNTRVDPCSKILKRQLTRSWLLERYDPATTDVSVGFTWDEQHRFDRAKVHWREKSGFELCAPLCEPPYLTRRQMESHLAARGIARPALYDLGFPHNNCGGFCIKAGQAHFELLLRKLPERYARHEAEEQRLREYLDEDRAILRDRRGGTVRPMTLREFRERVEAGGDQLDLFEWGGCGCFIGDDG